MIAADAAVLDQTTSFPTDHGPCRLVVAGNGNGLPLVLIHGYGASADLWRRLLPHIGERHAAYAPDLLGFGHAPKPRGPYTPERWAEQIRGLLDALALPRAVVVGHSLGGLVALTAARRFPERCAGLVLIDALGVPMPSLARAMRGAPGLLAQALRAPGVGEAIFWSLRGFRPLARGLALGAYHDPARAPADAVDAWLDLIHRPGAHRAYVGVARRIERFVVTLAPGDLTLPTLILWGAEDRGLPAALAGQFQRLLPQAEVVIIPDCGHIPQAEQPAAVADALLPFLARLEERATPSTARAGRLSHGDLDAPRHPLDDGAIG